jgi:hypothetical protein
LLVGALLALAPSAIDRAAAIALPMRVLGLAMIIASVFLYGEETPFPGVAALLPVCGALLIIGASPDRRDPVWKLLASAPMVYVGRISYSLYLWHWPVLGATRTLVSNHNDSHIALAIALSVALAALSYRFVEQPIRTRRKLARGHHMALLLASTSAVAGVVALAGWNANGWPGRFPPQLEAKIARGAQPPELPAGCPKRAEIADGRLCLVAGAGKGTVDLLLWGDSHAASLVPVLQKYAEAHGLALALAQRDGCPPLLDTGRERQTRRGIDRGCPVFNNAVRAFIREKDVPVSVLAGRWSYYAQTKVDLLDLKYGNNTGTGSERFERAVARTLDALSDRRVAIVQQVPEQNVRGPDTYIVLSRLGRPLDNLSVDRAQHERQKRATAAAMKQVAARDNALLINPDGVLCRGDKCLIEADGKLLYHDDDHLNADGSLYLYPLFDGELTPLLRKTGRLPRD